jgi:hypothetical protein
MECKACGYIRQFDFDNNKWVGDDDFIYIQTIVIHDTWEDKSKAIYACPECGTLKLDI